MPQLIPTPIIDRRGRATTVHRRAEQKQSRGGSQLADALPQLAGMPPAAPVTTIRAKDLKRWYPYDRSIICRENMYHWRIDELWDQRGDLKWEPADVEVPDDELYAYLRLGLDLNEVAMLRSVGVSAEQVGEDEHFAAYLPGRLGAPTIDGFPWKLRNGQAIDALQERGVPAGQAYALLENGLQDGHFEGVLDFDQVVEVLGKAKYRGVQGNHPEQKTSQAVDALVSGKIPFEMSRMNTVVELGRLADELRLLDPANEFKRRLAEDHDLTVRVVSHALKGLNRNDYGWDRLIERAFGLYEERPDAFFKVKALELLKHGTIDRTTGEMVHGLDVEDVQFIEEVAKGIRGKKGWTLLWDGYKSGKDTDLQLNHWDVKALRDAGASVEQAKDLLIERRMPCKLAVVAVRDGIAAPLLGGAL